MVASDMANAFGLLSWCKGEPIATLHDEEMSIFAQFLISLGGMSAHAENEGLPLASEACVAGAANCFPHRQAAWKTKNCRGGACRVGIFSS